jgi:hypothetical protein
VQLLTSRFATARIDDDHFVDRTRDLRSANDLALDVDDHADVGTRGRLCGGDGS